MCQMLEEWTRSEQIEVLYFLTRADCISSIQAAQEFGFRLTDIRMTLGITQSCRTLTSSCTQPDQLLIRPAVSGDLPALEAIARRSHRDSRFFADPRFPRSKAEDLYATWIRLECGGKANLVMVATTHDEAPVGYVSCHLDSVSGSGQIGLFAVHESARGKGVGAKLLHATLDWFWKNGAKQLSVVTQGRNIAAQRLYQRCGFSTKDVQLWFHYWAPAS
jgi:dTDP-4-amino-4,6-dideoxy-D-galactose acyltransferase